MKTFSRLIKNSYYYLFFICFLVTTTSQAMQLPNYGVPVWNNVATDLDVDITTLSKLCMIESFLPNISISTISSIEAIITSLSTIESYVEVIDSRAVDIESTVDNLNVFVHTTINSKIDLIENSDLSILSTVQVIDTRTSSIYSLDQNIASKTAANLETDQTILSKMMAIDTNLSNITVTCNGLSQLAQNDQSILSVVNVIDTRTSSIYNTDLTILSYVQEIDTQVITIGSLVNNLDLFVTTTINSKVDLIENIDLSILSVVNVIDTRTSSIYSLDQVISSQMDVDTTIETSIQSVVNIIDSKVDALSLNCSVLADIVQTDLTTLSKLNVIDTRTSVIQSNVNNIFSIDQIISSDVNNIFSLDQLIASKVDIDISIDLTIQSLVNVINANTNTSPQCSDIAQILENDLTVLSLVNVIDTRTSTIQSNVTNIFSIDQIISSKLDVNLNIDRSTQSTVNIIDSRTTIINSTVNNISTLNNAIYSVVAALSTCCTGTTANQSFTSIYGTQLVENRIDNISVQFQYGIPPTVATYTQGGGTVTTTDSMAILSTAASTDSIAQLQTKNTIVFRPGHEAYAYFTVAFTGSFATTSSQFIGPIDFQDGFAVGFDGATFGITSRSNAISTFIPQSQFNGDQINGTGASQFNYNPALLNVFRIAYGADGSSIVRFQIMSSFGDWITFHTIQSPNTSPVPLIQQPFLPITARAENLTGTSVLSMRTVSWNGGIVGEPNNSSYRYYQRIRNATIGLTEILVLALRNKTVFNGKANKIQVKCMAFGGGPILGDDGIAVNLRKNSTLTGTSFSDVDPGNSVMEVSTAGSFSGGRIVLVNPSVPQGNGAVIQLIPNNTYTVIILPGETLTITAASTAGGNDGTFQIAWEEQF